MLHFSPILNLIPLSVTFALFIAFLNLKMDQQEVNRKIMNVEQLKLKAVNESRKCGKDLTNKTVIVMMIKRRVENINKELGLLLKDYQQKTDQSISNEKLDKDSNVIKVMKNFSAKKSKVRQNRLQMYGVSRKSIYIFVGSNLSFS